MNKRIIILKSGNFKPDIYKDYMGIIREATDDHHQIGCHNDMGNKFYMVQREEKLAILPPPNNGPSSVEFEFDPKNLITDKQFVIIGAKFPVVKSQFLTIPDILGNMALMYLDKESNAVRDLYTNNIIDNHDFFIYPMGIINRLNENVYVVGINGEVLYPDCRIELGDEDTIMTGVWGIDASTLTVSNILFDAVLDGDLTRVGDIYHAKSDFLTLRLGHFSLLQAAYGNFNTGDITIDTTLPYEISSDGGFVTFDIRDVPKGLIQYLKVYMPYDKKTERFSSCRGDLPLVEYNIVVH